MKADQCRAVLVGCLFFSVTAFLPTVFAQPTAGASSTQQTAGTAPTATQGQAAAASDLAAKLANPVADLISVPFQFNWSRGMGRDGKGEAYDMVFQPVVPLKLNKDWNYIVRPVVTVGVQKNVDGYSGSGAGQVLLETFFAPNTNSKFVWGVGPVLSTPALSGNRWGTAQTGAGASAVALYAGKPWTAGVLAYQTWNVGGSAVAGTANNTYWQPFIAYVTPNAWTFSINMQSSFNWDSRRSENPMNFAVSKLTHIGKVPVSFQIGGRYYLSSVPGGPSGWGARAGITFILPK